MWSGSFDGISFYLIFKLLPGDGVKYNERTERWKAMQEQDMTKRERERERERERLDKERTSRALYRLLLFCLCLLWDRVFEIEKTASLPLLSIVLDICFLALFPQ